MIYAQCKGACTNICMYVCMYFIYTSFQFQKQRLKVCCKLTSLVTSSNIRLAVPMKGQNIMAVLILFYSTKQAAFYPAIYNIGKAQ